MTKMVLITELWNRVRMNGRLSKWPIQIRNVVTNNASAGENGEGPVSLKFKMYTDPDERRGYKFDGSLDLTALIDRSSAMGFINTSDADGFKARNFRTGGEQPDPEKAKEIMVFFKNRPKPPKQASTTSLRSILQSSMSKESVLGHAKDVASSFLNQRASLNAVDSDTPRGSSGRPARASDTASHQQSDQGTSAQTKVKAQAPTNLPYFNKSTGRKGSQSGSNQASNPPPRGSYKMSKPPKKQ